MHTTATNAVTTFPCPWQLSLLPHATVHHRDTLRPTPEEAKHTSSLSSHLIRNHQVPTLPLLRARCQNPTTLRSNLYNEEDTILPYRGIPCLRCNPTAFIDQGLLLLHTHHPVDNIHHLATSCVTTQDLREQLGQHFEAIMVELCLAHGNGPR